MQARQAEDAARAAAEERKSISDSRNADARIGIERSRLDLDRQRLAQDDIGVASDEIPGADGIGTIKQSYRYSKRTGQRIADAPSTELTEDQFVAKTLSDKRAGDIKGGEAAIREFYKSKYMNGQN
jgi:hypothetical protein